MTTKATHHTAEKVQRTARRGGRGQTITDTFAEIAAYYGFTAIGEPAVTKEDRALLRTLISSEQQDSIFPPEEFAVIQQKISILRVATSGNPNSLTQPIMLYFRSSGHKRDKGAPYIITMEIIDCAKSIAEAILIQASLAILREAGLTHLAVKINSVGDRESLVRYSRELSTYYRKHIEDLPQSCREALKTEVFELLRCNHDKCISLRNEAPNSIAFLSETCRLHFKEVLEYLEALETSYCISTTLIAQRILIPQTVFEVNTIPEGSEVSRGGTLLGCGLRYNYFARRIGYKREIPAIGVNLRFDAVRPPRVIIRQRKPLVFFIQLGYEAKLKSLKVIELLRIAGIPMLQCVIRDKLGGQLSIAENLKIPYTLIMGVKEAVEDTVIVRKMATRSQETVPLKRVADYLKSLHLRD